jgi:hypothetical protein
MAAGGAGALYGLILPQQQQEEDSEYKTRKGYYLKDLARSFVQALGETGSAAASGRLLHYTADFICSGGFPLWQRLCWDYAFDHIGIASPRIFYYLNRRFKEIDTINARLPFESFCTNAQTQAITAEIVLILQGCPRKTKIRPPPVPQDTHENEGWLASVVRASDKSATRKVWSGTQDSPEMLYAANELVQAITEGATERALFWMRWLIEEDALQRKKLGAGMSTCERGPATLASKQRTTVGYFICSVLAEVYKEFAEKGMVRLHEEFQQLLDLYRTTDGTLQARRKMDCMILMINILTEVPRWKVPAAPSLVQDPTVLSRAVASAPQFYREILMLPAPAKHMPKTVGSLAQKKVAKTDEKSEKITNQLEAMDRLIMGMYDGGL